MLHRHIVLGCLVLLLTAGVARTQDKLPGDRNPLLQLRTDGPTAQVTSLAFGFAGKGRDRKIVLYGGGYDKVVRTWIRGERDKFEPGKTYRLPIGPGVQGTINALAVSPDGRWLAAAGVAVVREDAGFFQTGFLMPRSGRMSDEMWKDEGTIYLFDTAGEKAHLLRGHRGSVLALAFAPAHEGKPPLLISAAREKSAKKPGFACVLRLWDASGNANPETPLASSPELPDPGNGRPGLAIWHTGGDRLQLRLAFTSQGQPLRIWDVARKEKELATVGERLFFNEPVAFAPDDADGKAGTLFTCGTPPEVDARLFARKVAGNARVGADSTREAPVPKDSLSEALALLRTERGGKVDCAALVQSFRKDRKPEDYLYHLVVLNLEEGERFGDFNANVLLWKGGFRPVLAASPDGRHLAIAGGPTHAVHLYDIRDREKPKPQEPMTSPGVIYRYVNFVRKKGKEESRGLLLYEKPDKERAWNNGRIFDLRQRLLTDERDGWEPDAPDPQGDGWSIDEPREPPEGKSDGWMVRHKGEIQGTVWLQKGQRWTDSALLPPGPRHPVPLLAIAFVENGVPYLGLWNVLSGQQVRQYTGHLNPIRWLAFDAAGQRLASAAEDQTVCVWNLDDLEQTLGRHGTLLGFAVKQEEREKKTLRVASSNRALLNAHNREALEQVNPGDLVEGLMVDGKLQEFSTPQAFYEAIWKLKPPAPWKKVPGAKAGDLAVLRIAGRDVSLQLDQGIDDYKPLFCLFVTQGEKRQWVGWNPEGPYDTGDLVGGERLIGWHFNTDKWDAPTSFAEAGKYHDRFYRDHILRYLLERGSVPKALNDWKTMHGSRPRIDLSIARLDPRALQDQARPPIVRNKELMLQTRVLGIHPARVEKVEWRIARQREKGWESVCPPRPFDRTDGLLKADLAKEIANWQPGLYEVRVAVTLGEDPSNPVTESVWFRYELPEKPIKPAFGTEKLPRFQLVSPRVVEANAEETIELVGRLIPPADSGPDYPIEKVIDKVLVKDRKVPHKLDPESHRLRFRAALERGHNRIRVLLTNGRQGRTEEVDVYRKRPPLIVSVKPVGAPGPKSVSFEIVVKTARELPLKQASLVRTKVDNKRVDEAPLELPNGRWKKQTAEGDFETWNLALEEVLLKEGVNNFELHVANEDGPAKPEPVSAKGVARLPAPPRVRFAPLPPGAVAEPRCNLAIHVNSSTPLGSLKLLRNGEEVDLHRMVVLRNGEKYDLGELGKRGAEKEPADADYAIAGVPLGRGPNVLIAVASNGGGSASSEPANVSYVEPTVDYRLKGYKIRGQTGELLSLDRPSLSSRVELYGELEWPTDTDPSLKQPMRVRVWVNDFEQRDVELRDAEGRVRPFRVPLFLNRERNRVQLLPDKEAILKEGVRPECMLQCKNPEKRQRLHLLIVAPGLKDTSALKASVLKAFGATKPDADGRFSTKAFAGGGHVYVNRPDDNRREIISLLRHVHGAIRGAPGDFSDVVIVYFQGEMRRDEKGKQYLLVSADDDKKPLPDWAIDCDEVRERLGDVLGAKLLLLDVNVNANDEKESVGSVADSSGLVGDFQYLWLGGANKQGRRNLIQDLDETLKHAQRWGTVREQLSKAPGKGDNLAVRSANPAGYDEIPLKENEKTQD